ncbi:IclR family transcriptional regulator [Leucobacter sp. CSA1]|uniref:IclR family transcriptional regulator n=1 Tax=Leucobacter chromiisoli TaxID=2796471 RepID=A0A934UVC7_9MICO|nr:IclR family transcriptional regulator [Leucobacter chromiisoli]
MRTSSKPYHSQGLARALAALRALGQARDPMSLADLAKELELPKPTLLRLLSVLEEERFVTKSGAVPLYSIGPSVFEIAESAGFVDFEDVVSVTLKALADDLGFTANIGVLQGRSVLHLCVEEPARALRIANGGFLDHTYCTGLGKMLLSQLDPASIDQHLPLDETWQSFTPRTITSREQLDRALASIREHGYSVDDQERNRGVRCLAVLIPVKASFDLSLSVSGPLGEISEAEVPRVVDALHRTAQEIAQLPRLSVALESVRTRWGIE